MAIKIIHVFIGDWIVYCALSHTFTMVFSATTFVIELFSVLRNNGSFPET
ncbi:MAG: hypothetical protein WCG25_02570 [bacterium]